jgi:succinate dehydrogenase / fumarate reductase cytochrome b subunit
MELSDRAYLLLKRLQSLTGVLPVGLFLLIHFGTNAFAVAGPRAFDRAATSLDRLPFVAWLEILGVGLPIAVHLVLAFVLARASQDAEVRRDYPRPWMLPVLRVCGGILAVYVVYHVWGARLAPEVLHREASLFGHMEALLAHPGVLAFYALGVLAASIHLGLGTLGFAIQWGLARGHEAQRKMTRLAWALTLVFALVGLNALFAFTSRPFRWLERSVVATTSGASSR